MAYEAVDCVDAGTEYCPCYLAETNDCLICSQLQGKVFCDCINWKGVCIYQEYVWNGNKRKDSREDMNACVLQAERINDKILFLKLKVTRTLARELNQPGSYIFIRPEKYPQYFDAPMSIMYADEINETIDLLIQVRGAKTKVLCNPNENVVIKGPYWNGIMGLKNLKMVFNDKCLIAARGMSQAPSVIVAKKLKFSGNDVTVILDGGTVDTVYSRKYFENIGCKIIEAKIMDNRTFNESTASLIREIIKEDNIRLVFSAGSDIIHRNIAKISRSLSECILFACTNNANICCGEGICGSCATRMKDGKKIKACKAQVDPVDLIGGIS